MNEYFVLLYMLSCCGRGNCKRECLPHPRPYPCEPCKLPCEPCKPQCKPCNPPCEPCGLHCPPPRPFPILPEEGCCGEKGGRDFFGVTSQIFNMAYGMPFCPPQNLICPPPCPPPCEPPCPPRPPKRCEREERSGCEYYNNYNPRLRHW